MKNKDYIITACFERIYIGVMTCVTTNLVDNPRNINFRNLLCNLAQFHNITVIGNYLE